MSVLKTIGRLLTFRLTRDEMLAFDGSHFFAGMAGTWVVGMGRYWDHGKASLMQHLGVGSVIYIFILAGLIWLIVKPYFIKDWTYFRVLTFIGLTSFPAIIYAVPVEKFFSIGTANAINAWFLAIVALWRLSLLFYFLRKFTQLSAGYIVVITLLPVCLIIFTLTILNLDHVVFNVMSGIENQSPHAGSYLLLWFLTGISAFLIVPLLIFYINGISVRYPKKKKKTSDQAE